MTAFLRSGSLACLCILAICCADANAQSTLTIPNPLMRPPTFASKPGSGTSPEQVQPSGPLPTTGSEARGRGQSPLPFPGGPIELSPEEKKAATRASHENLVRDVLANFTATAILGDRASLRTGFTGNASAPSGSNPIPAPMPNQPSMMPAMSPQNQQPANPNATTNAGRQTVMRVKSGQPVYLAGVEVTPTVFETHVECRLAGQVAVVGAVMLESTSSYGYVPISSSREIADPTVSSRVNPATAQTGGTNGAQSSAVNGSSSNASSGSPSSPSPTGR